MFNQPHMMRREVAYDEARPAGALRREDDKRSNAKASGLELKYPRTVD